MPGLPEHSPRDLRCQPWPERRGRLARLVTCGDTQTWTSLVSVFPHGGAGGRGWPRHRQAEHRAEMSHCPAEAPSCPLTVLGCEGDFGGDRSSP